MRIITDSAPGSAIDVPVRIIAEGLSKIWGQQAVVINQPGAGGAIAARTAATATPDGYTLGVAGGLRLRGAAGNGRQSADPGAERFHAGRLSRRRADVHHRAPWLGVKTLPELIALAKSETRRTLLRRQRHRTTDPSHRRIAAKPAGIKLLMVPYSGGTAQVHQRHDGQARRARVRRLFGDRRRGRSRQCRPARGRVRQAACRFPNLPTVAETCPALKRSAGRR